MRPATSPAFGFLVSSHLAGVSGGLAAIPVWELLRGIGKKTCCAGVPPASQARSEG